MSKKKLKPLIPPDLKQCQGERHNGNSFMTLGGVPGYIRCEKKPIVIATERKPGKDGRIGSMSLCMECWTAMMEQLGDDHAIVKPITKGKK